MVSSLNYRLSSPVLSLGQGLCVLLLHKTLAQTLTQCSHSASLHPGVHMDTSKFNAAGQPCNGLASQLGEEEILPIASCLQPLNQT